MKQCQPECKNFGQRGQITVDGGRPALDRVLEALSREDDRYIMYYLMDDGPTEFDELVDAQVAKYSGEFAEVPDDVREEIEIKLHHVRLPKLEDLGIIEFDHRNGSIRLRNPPQHFEEFLRLARELDEK